MMDFSFMEKGRDYAFHIRSKEELISFSEAERNSIYEALRFSSGVYVKDDPKRGDILEWNLARWEDATGNRYYDGSIYLTLFKLRDSAIEIGWECHLEWMKSQGYEIIEWSDFLKRETFSLPSFDALLE